jgi:hypothetical protein
MESVNIQPGTRNLAETRRWPRAVSDDPADRLHHHHRNLRARSLCRHDADARSSGRIHRKWQPISRRGVYEHTAGAQGVSLKVDQ